MIEGVASREAAPLSVSRLAAAMAADPIASGDIVRASVRGRIFHALVRGAMPGGYRIEPIEQGVRARTVKAGDVIDHWSRRGNPGGAGPNRKAQASFDHLLDR
jgi:hypothetical protein